MATKETTPDMPLPTEGGSYVRDDQTGTLTRAEYTETTPETTQPVADAAASDKE